MQYKQKTVFLYVCMYASGERKTLAYKVDVARHTPLIHVII